MRCTKKRHVCHLRATGWCDVRGEAARGPRVQVPDYVCVDRALPKRRLEVFDTAGGYARPGVSRKNGVDNDPFTKLYPRVDKAGRPVFKNKSELTRFFSHDIVRQRGYVYDR